MGTHGGIVFDEQEKFYFPQRRQGTKPQRFSWRQHFFFEYWCDTCASHFLNFCATTIGNHYLSIEEGLQAEC
jgi:hypothetical protein